MSRLFGKKQILMATLILALGVAVYLNYYFTLREPGLSVNGRPSASSGKNFGDAQFVNGTPSASNVPEKDTDYFSQARKNRENARKESLDLIKNLMNDVKATEAIKREAMEKTTAIALTIQQESKIESLVKAKGFTDCVAFIEGGTCHVVVKSKALQPQQAVQITEIITSQSAVKAQNINIVTVK